MSFSAAGIKQRNINIFSVSFEHIRLLVPCPVQSAGIKSLVHETLSLPSIIWWFDFLRFWIPWWQPKEFTTETKKSYQKRSTWWVRFFINRIFRKYNQTCSLSAVHGHSGHHDGWAVSDIGCSTATHPPECNVWPHQVCITNTKCETVLNRD